MNNKTINEFVEKNQAFFTAEDMNYIIDYLKTCSEDWGYKLESMNGFRSPNVALALALFGFDRIYLQDYAVGITKLLLDVFFIWRIFDLFSLRKRVSIANINYFNAVMQDQDITRISGQDAKAFVKKVAPAVIQGAKTIKGSVSELVDTF